jgi:methylthioribose-1-phosphate isomerase
MSEDSNNTLRSLIYNLDTSTTPPTATLSVLDQLLLPHSTTYIPINTVQDAWTVIRTMQIRGAPLIAIVAVLGLAVDLTSNVETVSSLQNKTVDEIKAIIEQKMEYLKTSRPTAVNLFNAMEELSDIILKDASITSREALLEKLTSHASYMLQRDVSDNKLIGSHGADDILANRDESVKVQVITICNTGSLATAGWGTALGVARELCARGRMDGIACLETRP